MKKTHFPMNLWPCDAEKLLAGAYLDGIRIRFRKQPDRMIDTYDSAATFLFEGITINTARAVWCLVYGDWPGYKLRHINGDSRNNTPDNLELDLKQPIFGFAAAKRAIASDALWLAPRTKPLFNLGCNDAKNSEAP